MLIKLLHVSRPIKIDCPSGLAHLKGKPKSAYTYREHLSETSNTPITILHLALASSPYPRRQDPIANEALRVPFNTVNLGRVLHCFEALHSQAIDRFPLNKDKCH